VQDSPSIVQPTEKQAESQAESQTAALEITEGEQAGDATQPTNPTAADQPTETPEPTPEAVPELSEADLAAYQGALQLLDESFCDKITQDIAKQECKTQVTDQKTLNAALAAVDASQCEKMSTDDKKEACRTQVEVITAKQTEKDEFEKEKKENQDKVGEIINSEDYTRCSELTIDNLKADCELTILVNKVIKDKDISWCDKASAENQEQCKFMGQTALSQDTDNSAPPML